MFKRMTIEAKLQDPTSDSSAEADGHEPVPFLPSSTRLATASCSPVPLAPTAPSLAVVAEAIKPTTVRPALPQSTSGGIVAAVGVCVYRYGAA